jgi:hypothetical protein
MKTCLEALTLGDMYSNVQKNFQESIQTQQEYLKIQQEKTGAEFSVGNGQREVYL